MQRIAIRSVSASAAVALAAGFALAVNYGRVTQPNEVVTTTISPAGDADDFVFDAAPGFKVKASVKKAKEADLAPVLTLLAPDGSALTDGMKIKAGKTSASVSGALPLPGRYGLRVSGTTGTGQCTLKWKLQPAKVATVKKLLMPGDTQQPFRFPARGGALLGWNLKWKGDGTAQVIRLLDPAGVEIPFDPDDPTWFKRTLTSEKATAFPIPADRPGGLYTMVVHNELFESTITLSTKVALPVLPKTTVILNPVKPVLASIDHTQSSCGVTVNLLGQNFDAAPMGVLFGTQPATNVVVTLGATPQDPDSVACDVPGGSGTVDVAFVASDGQMGVLLQAFTFNPPPTITSFEPTVGPNVGRIDFVLHGTGFETEGKDVYRVLIGGVDCFNVKVEDPATITAQIPANVSGPKTVVLRNRCGENVVAPGQFTYSSLLSISIVVPPAVPTFGQVPVTVYGAGFGATNEVYVDGVLLPSTPVLFQGTVIGHRIEGADLPGHAPGKVDVKVKQGGTESVKTGGLAYYGFTDVTATAIPAASATDDWGAVSTAAVDGNLDGKVDYLVLTHGTSLSLTRPGTRVLKNNGSGVFTDITGTAMPAADIKNDWGGNKVLAGRFNGDTSPDLYLSRPGTGTEAKVTTDLKYVDGWGRLFLGTGSDGFNPQPNSGVDSKFSIPGQLVYGGWGTPTKCFLFDFDFRSVAASMGDLDGDLDQDVLLVNDTSIQWFKGTNCNYVWITCLGYYASCYTWTTYDVGSAVRFCTLGSTGGMFDRTAAFLSSAFTTSDDFRGVACAIADVDADSLNDVVITHNDQPGTSPTPVACTRALKQKGSGVSVNFSKIVGWMPGPASAADDDWRGDSIALPDLDADLYRDLVIALDGPIPNGRTFSTRILMQDSVNKKMVDKTDTLLTGVLPAGDVGLAKFVLGQDVDRDGDGDIILCTPTTAGTGNRMTRFLLNAGKDPVSGLPVLMDASVLLPDFASDPGNAVTVLAADIDGDGDNDLIVTDTHVSGGTVRRTRIWRQDR